MCELYPNFKKEYKNMQRQDVNSEKIVVTHITDKGKNSHKSIRKDNSVDKQTNYRNRRITKRKQE